MGRELDFSEMCTVASVIGLSLLRFMWYTSGAAAGCGCRVLRAAGVRQRAGVAGAGVGFRCHRLQ